MAKDKRVEVLFEPAEYKLLEDAAHREGKSVGSMVREAVVKYVTGPTQAEREQIWQELMALQGMGGPSGSPEEIKAELIEGLDDHLERKLQQLDDVEAD